MIIIIVFSIFFQKNKSIIEVKYKSPIVSKYPPNLLCLLHTLATSPSKESRYKCNII